MKEYLKKSCDIFFDELKQISLVEKNTFMFNPIYYKIAKDNNKLFIFLENIKPYYKEEYYYFFDNITYNRFTTLLRQICFMNKIQFTKKIKYNFSKYIIEYTFFNII